MVAKITTPVSINRALNYNEQKVQKGKAECLFAGNFLRNANELNFYGKLERFQKLLELNSSKTNTLHISLNFHPSENFSKETLIRIAETYVNKIGFSEQPFLVYQHFDAGHPHLHIVTTTIQENGKRIDTYNIGKNQSQTARKEIETAYGLVKAEEQKNEKKQISEEIKGQKIKYGVDETKRAITNVLSIVVHQYKYASLPELNAVLKLYNVAADRGSEGSRIYQHRGLHYHLLNEKGNKIGVPIKASSIYFKPTLHYLEEKFSQNDVARKPYISKIKTAIDWTLSKKPTTLPEFITGLKKENITAVIRENEQGFIYGITFIDNRNKIVLNGSDLGKKYSAAGIKQNIEANASPGPTPPLNLLAKKENADTSLMNKQTLKSRVEERDIKHDEHSNGKDLLELLVNKERIDPRIPFDLIKRKKKRKKPKL